MRNNKLNKECDYLSDYIEYSKTYNSSTINETIQAIHSQNTTNKDGETIYKSGDFSLSLPAIIEGTKRAQAYSEKDAKIFLFLIREFTNNNTYKDNTNLKRATSLSLTDYIERIENKKNTLANRKKYSSILSQRIKKLSNIKIEHSDMTIYENKKKPEKTYEFLNIFERGYYKTGNAELVFTEAFARHANTNQITLLAFNKLFLFKGLTFSIYYELLFIGGIASNIKQDRANIIKAETIRQRCGLPSDEQLKEAKKGFINRVVKPFIKSLEELEGGATRGVISLEYRNKKGELVDIEELLYEDINAREIWKDLYIHFSLLDHPSQRQLTEGEYQKKKNKR